jgi:hypothetical protein
MRIHASSTNYLQYGTISRTVWFLKKVVFLALRLKSFLGMRQPTVLDSLLSLAVENLDRL